MNGSACSSKSSPSERPRRRAPRGRRGSVSSAVITGHPRSSAVADALGVRVPQTTRAPSPSTVSLTLLLITDADFEVFRTRVRSVRRRPARPSPTTGGAAPVARRTARRRRGAARLEVAHQSRARARRPRRRARRRCARRCWSRDSELMVEGAARARHARSSGCRPPAGSATTCASSPADELARLDHDRLRTRRHGHALPAAGRRARARPDDVRRRRGRPPPADGRRPSTALRALGVDLDDDGRGALPFTVHGTGRVAGGALEIDASASSQFVSGLLLSAAAVRAADSTCATSASGSRACRTSR